MRPESTSAAARPVLTEFAREYYNEKALSKFIGLRAAPLFRANKRTGEYPIFNRESFKKRVTNQTRAPGGAYNRIGGEFGVQTYACAENGLEYPVDDVMLEQYADLFDAESAATEILIQQILMGHEARVAALYSGAGLTNHNVTTAWTTVATATAIADFEAGFNAICDACGCLTSDLSIIIPRTDFLELQKVDEIQALAQYTWKGSESGMIPSSIPAATIANMLGCKELLVAQGSYDAQEEGYAESNTQFWTAAVIYIALLAGQESGLSLPSQARTMLWTGDSPDFPVIESYREEQVRADIVRARFQTNEVVTAATDILAYKMTNT